MKPVNWLAYCNVSYIDALLGKVQSPKKSSPPKVLCRVDQTRRVQCKIWSK